MVRLVNQSIATLVPNLPGKSREALAVWTPIGLVQPCVLPFGQKNSGTEAQGPYRIAISQLSIDSRQHLDPIRNLVPPSDVSELRRVLGIFVQSRKYINNYAHIVKPMHRMMVKEPFFASSLGSLRNIPTL